jgi:pre-rRNA-processing protein TSR1
VKLAACGSVRSCDPDRVVLKKITLTGFPVRVHKRRATVKFMFYNPDDIRWFKPVELYTKYGRRGTIEEPIGTHGAMKCMFDAPVQQRDAVCMSLYKRVFPKWPQALDFSE